MQTGGDLNEDAALVYFLWPTVVSTTQEKSL